jgi:hypothetical protein
LGVFIIRSLSLPEFLGHTSHVLTNEFYRLACEAVHVKRFTNWITVTLVKGPVALWLTSGITLLKLTKGGQ